jgi:O-acetyl-ADP-ribose deacetylase (regulator of RNase III)
MNFDILFCDISDGFKEGFDLFLKKYENISYHCCDFKELENTFDCVVSPANSFAIFDGGFDGAINQYFNEIKQFTVEMQTQLLDKRGGYVQPGTCVLLATKVDKCKYVALCPTMVIPSVIVDYSIIYHCFWNLLITIHNHNKTSDDKIKNVLLTGLGTGIGNVCKMANCRLLDLAIENYLSYLEFIKSNKMNATGRYILDWTHANDTYKKLYYLLKDLEKNKPYTNDVHDMINERRASYY